MIDSVRERRPDDSIEKLTKEKKVACVIQARDEFPDLDIVLPWRAPFTLMKMHHGAVRPFIIRHNGEEIMCNLS